MIPALGRQRQEFKISLGHRKTVSKQTKQKAKKREWVTIVKKQESRSEATNSTEAGLSVSHLHTGGRVRHADHFSQGKASADEILPSFFLKI